MVRPPPTRRAPAASPDGAAIAEAALRVLHEGGPHALSFRRVAALLGTSHMTVHRHCHNLEGLLDLCADHLAATLPEIDRTRPWSRCSGAGPGSAPR